VAEGLEGAFTLVTRWHASNNLELSAARARLLFSPLTVIVLASTLCLSAPIWAAEPDSSDTSATSEENKTERTSQEEVTEEPSPGSELDPQQILQEARSHYERGDFDQAAADFSSVLDSPVKLRTRQNLHEGFLYYAFTLLLQGDPHSAGASEKLHYALRLDPDHLPSPVTTRPDILEFYNRQRDAYIAANGPVSEPPEILFPELQSSGTSTRVLRRRWFVPVFGIGLRFLGHPRAANWMMGTEIAALGVNLASVLVRVALIEDLSPAGFAATEIGRYSNYISFSVFWVALIADVVISLALRRAYERHPERRPSNRQSAMKRKPPRRPRLALSPKGLALEFW